MRWTLEISLDRRVTVTIVDRKVIGEQVVQTMARMVKGHPEEQGKSSRSKAGDGKGNAFNGNCSHHWMLGHMEKNVSSHATQMSQNKNASSPSNLDESEKNGSEDTSIGGFGLCSLRNHCDDWKWKHCRKVTFTLDNGAAVSAAPKSLGDDPMQIEEPRSCKTATGSLVQDEGFRVLPIVTEEGCIVA